MEYFEPSKDVPVVPGIKCRHGEVIWAKPLGSDRYEECIFVSYPRLKAGASWFSDPGLQTTRGINRSLSVKLPVAV